MAGDAFKSARIGFADRTEPREHRLLSSKMGREWEEQELVEAGEECRNKRRGQRRLKSESERNGAIG
eukprot:6202961-Pleurochrysis_carterae.AAC.1